MITLQQEVARHLSDAIQEGLHYSGEELLELCQGTLREPPRPEWGDFASPMALTLAEILNRPTRQIAGQLQNALGTGEQIFGKVDVAGNGYLNLTLAPHALVRFLNMNLSIVPHFEIPSTPHPTRVNIEFVSANPTGPLHIGHARWAVIGDVLARLLRAARHRVETEYYVNDMGQQIELLGKSALALQSGLEPPEGGYGGVYLSQLVGRLSLNASHNIGIQALQEILKEQKSTLAKLRVHFNRFFFEHEIHEKGEITTVVKELESRGYLSSEAGSVLFRSSAFGDEKDRVLIRAKGGPTYFAADLAYHQDKFERGYDQLINVWGADHHGYVSRMRGGIKALGLPEEKLHIIIGQLVSLSRGGQAIRMSKRTGDVITVDEVVDEVGVDAVRYFLLQTRAESHVQFDLELAKKQSNENPVYYIQYAHARCVRILEEAHSRNLPSTLETLPENWKPESLIERALALQMLNFGDLIAEAAERHEPHRVAHALLRFAKTFHNWYHQHRVLVPEEAARSARLHLVTLSRTCFSAVLELLGISAPDHM